MPVPPLDREHELRRELIINHLYLDLGRKPTEGEITTHMIEMDRAGSHYGAHHVGGLLDNEARVRVEHRKQEEVARAASDEVERAAAQRELDREARLRMREDEQRKVLEEREKAQRPGESLASLPDEELK